jgi:3-hydroxybutyryl-CoA dehydrogenase
MNERAIVIGGGAMGRGIASVLARAQYVVAVVDAGDELAHNAVSATRAILDQGARRGKYSKRDASSAADRLLASASVEEVEGPIDVVIEAIPEIDQLKRQILTDAEQCEPRLLATNTSGISIDGLASALLRPDRFIGLHFFNPVPVMGLVEVVVGAATSDDARAQALELVERIGKEPVVVRDAPGFASTRLGVLLGLEAIRMVQDAVAEPEDIDRAMVLGYRHPIGPLRLTDLIGLDVRLDIARNLQVAYGERFAPPDLLETMVQQGRLGKKSGQGFYEWSE